MTPAARCGLSTIHDLGEFTGHAGLINCATDFADDSRVQQKEAAIRTASFASVVFDNNFDNELG